MNLQEDIERNKSLMNIAKFSDLTKSGDWDARRHGREEKGVFMYTKEGGLLKKKETNNQIEKLVITQKLKCTI